MRHRLLVFPFAAGQRADDGKLISDFSRQRKDLADLNPSYVGRNWLKGSPKFHGSIRLHVPQIGLRRSATQPDENARPIFSRASCLQAEVVRKVESEHP